MGDLGKSKSYTTICFTARELLHSKTSFLPKSNWVFRSTLTSDLHDEMLAEILKLGIQQFY